MFSRNLLLAVLAFMPIGLAAQTATSAPKDTGSTQFCRNFVYTVPNDTAARRDTALVSSLLPKTNSTCPQSTASQPRSTARQQSVGAPRTPPRVVRAPQPAPSQTQPVQTELPRQSGAPVQHVTHITHSDTTVVRIDYSVNNRVSTLDRFFTHVGKHKRIYGAVGVVLTAWCIVECGGDNTQSTTVIVNR